VRGLSRSKQSGAAKPRRKRLTYANVAATLALVLAMSGGALAASNFIITSTGQIKPSVLKKLTGKRGKTGATGKRGSQGIQGIQGNQGNAGAPNPNATTVDGQTVDKIFTDMLPSATPIPAVIFARDGLTLTADCDGTNQLGLFAQVTDPNSELNVEGNVSGTFTEQEHEGPGTSIINLFTTDPGPNQGSMTLAYANTSGQTVSMILGFDYDGAFTGNNCGVWGTATSS
jgi:hypothetical protein